MHHAVFVLPEAARHMLVVGAAREPRDLVGVLSSNSSQFGEVLQSPAL